MRKSKAAAAGDHQGRHKDVPTAFEIPLPDYDFHLEDGDFEGLPQADDEVDSFPVVDAEELGIDEISLVDVSAKKVIDQLFYR